MISEYEKYLRRQIPSRRIKMVKTEMPRIKPAEPPMSDRKRLSGYASTSRNTLDGNSDKATRNLVTFLNSIM